MHTLTARLASTLGRISRLAAVAALFLWSGNSLRAAGQPEIDPSYANGQTVYMIGPHFIVGAKPNLLAQAEELYLLVYPQEILRPDGSLPGGYVPQCDPCFHPGLPPAFVYHDHVLTGLPGFGKNGTAGVYLAPWQIIILMYNPDVASAFDFKPITNADDIDPAEAAGWFIPPIPGFGLELNTANVLICPFVSSHVP
jgi:hypothetical protein